MQYGGGSGGHPTGRHRLITPSLAPRAAGEREGRPGALPEILWRASGVTTRPGSGLRLTVRHMDVPQNHSEAMPPLAAAQGKTNARISRSELSGRPLQYQPPPCSHRHQWRSSLRDTLLSRQKVQPSALLPTSGSSTAAHPKATRTMLPPLPPVSSPSPQLTEERAEQEERASSSSSQDDSSSLEDSEEEIYSEEEGDTTPPSRPGFESEAEQSTHVFHIPFSPVSTPNAPFPATLLQDHLQLDMERYNASVLPSGLSPRVNNIVRAFTIRGPLDLGLLSRALDSVASLHPVLCACFQRTGDRLYMQTPPPGPVSVSLESPVVSHEKPETLITNARRKPFPLHMRSDLVSASDGSGGDRVLSIVSLASSKNSDDSEEGKLSKRRHLPSSAAIKKSVTFGQVTKLQTELKEEVSKVLPVLGAGSQVEEETRTILMRARLVQESVREATLVLSFPRIICDYWSSSLFVRQLAEAYGQLERASGVSRRIEGSRREVVSRFGNRRPSNYRSLGQGREVGRVAVCLGERGGGGYKPSLLAQLSFHQVALRERQLLKFVSREKHWAFWEGLLTAVIRRQRGPNRVKVVPPVRIPSGLGEKIQRVPRPQTSRLRPLTGRGRPQTGRRLVGEPKDTLAGPRTEFHFIKFEKEVCVRLRESLREETGCQGVREEDLLCLVCLGAYVLLLGRCCRGWGEEERKEREGERASPQSLLTSRAVRDPLQQYTRCEYPPRRGGGAQIVRVPQPSASPHQRSRRARMGGRLDLGSFLVGVEVSLRGTNPRHTQGLFGPLTYDVGIRVNLSSSETFLDLVAALGKTLQSVRNHHTFPFSTVTDELGVPAGLPVRFSYLHHSDILQLSDPAHFYFPETAVGVKDHSLARFGSTCYLSPLCTRMDDSCHLELCLWEGYDSQSVGGVFLYQPRALRRNLVEGVARELSQLVTSVTRDPRSSLSLLSSSISSHSRSHRTTHHH